MRISRESADLMYSQLSNAQTVIAHMGKVGQVYNNNLSIIKPHLSRASAFAKPFELVKNAYEFKIEVRGWLHNYGINNINGAKINAKVYLVIVKFMTKLLIQ